MKCLPGLLILSCALSGTASADTDVLAMVKADPATAVRKTTDLVTIEVVYAIDICPAKDTCDRFYTDKDKLPELADYALLYFAYMPDDLVGDDRVAPVEERPLRFVQHAKQMGDLKAILSKYAQQFSCEQGKGLPKCVLGGIAGALNIKESKVKYRDNAVDVFSPDEPGKTTD
jgi:hypothetical protein